MEEERSWDKLIPDALNLIFCRLSLEMLLTVIPNVCKSWKNVVNGSYYWQEIDIEEWCETSTPDKINKMVRMLVNRSGGCMRKFSASKLRGDSIISFIASNATFLQTLKLTKCEMSDEVIEREADKFSSITSLDLSYSYFIGARALEAMGNNCQQLTSFTRRMYPDFQNMGSHDFEAIAIADTMSKLTKLDISYLMVESEAVMYIIEKCPNLESLDLKGCRDLWMDEEELRQMFPKLKILNLNSNLEEFQVSNGWNDEEEDDEEDEEEDEEDIQFDLPIMYFENNNMFFYF